MICVEFVGGRLDGTRRVYDTDAFKLPKELEFDVMLDPLLMTVGKIYYKQDPLIDTTGAIAYVFDRVEVDT